MKVYAHTNHRGNVEVNDIQTNQPGEIALIVVEGSYFEPTPGKTKQIPEPGDIIAVNGIQSLCRVTHKSNPPTTAPPE
jgi:hypothetical protein